MFVHATPESEGISSLIVLRFLDELEKYSVNMHGFSLSRGNIILAEGYWKPFHKDCQHPMYSVGKSFVSLAIGLLREEGRLSLEDRICSYFPEYLPEPLPPFIGDMTIGDLLTMRSAHAQPSYNGYGGNWVESFFRVPPDYAPGSFFSYDTSASHTLSALVEKLSGMSLMDYLRARVFDRIGFSRDARFQTDPQGVSRGGSGLVCTMEDIRNGGYLFLNSGEWEGEQLIPRTYIKDALTKQADTSFQEGYDERWGYGYQVWKTRHDGFALYGLGGQLVLGLPRTGLMLTTIADTMDNSFGTGTIQRCFWEIILPAWQKSPLPGNGADQLKLVRRLHHLSITPPPTGHPPLPGALTVIGSWDCGELNSRADISDIRFSRKEDSLILRYKWKGKRHVLPFGLFEPVESSLAMGGGKYPCYGYVTVLDDGVLRFTLKITGDSLGGISILAARKGDNLSLRIGTYRERELKMLDGCYGAVRR